MKRKGLDRTKKMQSSCTFFKFHHILYLITMMHEIKYFIPYIDQTKIEKIFNIYSWNKVFNFLLLISQECNHLWHFF